MKIILGPELRSLRALLLGQKAHQGKLGNKPSGRPATGRQINACEAVLPHAFKMAFLYSIHLLFMETPEVDRHSHLTQKKKTQAQRPEPPAWTHTGGTRIQRHQRPLAAPSMTVPCLPPFAPRPWVSIPGVAEYLTQESLFLSYSLSRH